MFAGSFKNPWRRRRGKSRQAAAEEAVTPPPANTGTLMVVGGSGSTPSGGILLNMGNKEDTGNYTAVPDNGSYRATRTGTIRNFRVHVASNATAGAASTLTLNINGVATALTISIPAGFTGDIDAVGTAPVTEDDLVAIEYTKPEAGIVILTATYDMPGAAGQTTAMVHGANTVAPAVIVGMTVGTDWNGFFDSSGATKALAEVDILYRATHAGTFRRFNVVVPGNTLTAPLPVTLRINGADTALTVSVPALSSAPVSIDVPVAVAAGDLVSVVADGSGIRGGFSSFVVASYDYVP